MENLENEGSILNVEGFPPLQEYKASKSGYSTWAMITKKAIIAPAIKIPGAISPMRYPFYPKQNCECQ